MQLTDSYDIELWTEGKTDWQILKTAHRKLGLSLRISYHETNERTGGDGKLLSNCESFAERGNVTPLLFIFDSDVPNIIPKVSTQGMKYKSWGNNVFSMILPTPPNRPNSEAASIELFFSDDELKTTDESGRRFYLSTEFDVKSGKHKQQPLLSLRNAGILKEASSGSRVKIIDNEVYDGASKNVALSKAIFANNVSNDVPPFDKLNFSNYWAVFEIVNEIVSVTRPEINPYKPLVNNTADITPWQYLYESVETIMLAIKVFVAATVRFYGDAISSAEPPKYRKKVQPIKEILSASFREPSRSTWLKLCRNCYYLVDETAPQVLRSMKSAWDKTFILNNIGHLLDSLEQILVDTSVKPKLVNKHLTQKNMLTFVAPELIRLFELIESTKAHLPEITEPVRHAYYSAREEVNAALGPLLTTPIILRTVESVDAQNKQYSVVVRRYTEGRVSTSSYQVPAEDAQDADMNTTELVLSDEYVVSAWPFHLIKDNILHGYVRTLAKGYEYRSAIAASVFMFPTKRKFDHAIFKQGSNQALYWVEARPVLNEQNDIKANLPFDENEDFTGRHRQITDLRQDIIEIENRDGIIFGPGGIGKTALMLKLAKELYEEVDKSNVLYDNIIWVSAKKDFYDHIFDSIEKRDPQIRSLDNVLTAILQFFDIDELEGYDVDDKKTFVLELLQDYRVLLIIDNLETVSATEVDKIIHFFGTEAKKKLKKKPGNFKVVITSRQLWPTGFYPFELHGLDSSESKELMRKILSRYKHRSDLLTEEQLEQLHEATRGIPIVIKHTLAKIYEYNESIDTVIHNLLDEDSQNIIQFSFNEILQRVERKDKDQLQLKILILCEIYNRPLMARQIADILGVTEGEVEKSLKDLIDYQCVTRVNGTAVKYFVYEEIRLLTRSLAQKHDSLAHELRKKLSVNLTVDKQLDYTEEELSIVGLFENYLEEGDYREADMFIMGEIKKRTSSILIPLHYAKYLMRSTQQHDQAIHILEQLRDRCGDHPAVLKQLFRCYRQLPVPNIERATYIAKEIEKQPFEDDEIQHELGRFYLEQSNRLKEKPPYEDKLNEGVRQQEYKTFAQHALDHLMMVRNKTHEIYYLQAESYKNMWNYDMALDRLGKAIELAGDDPRNPVLKNYQQFRNDILDKRQTYRR